MAKAGDFGQPDVGVPEATITVEQPGPSRMHGLVRSDSARLQAYSRQRAALLSHRGLSERQRQLESLCLLAAFPPQNNARISALQEAGALG